MWSNEALYWMGPPGEEGLSSVDKLFTAETLRRRGSQEKGVRSLAARSGRDAGLRGVMGGGVIEISPSGCGC
jgi:hypothetical protein